MTCQHENAETYPCIYRLKGKFQKNNSLDKYLYIIYYSGIERQNVMKGYENLIILDPSIGEEGINNKIEQVKKFIEEGKGECTNIDKWGIKTFAYPIKKKTEGYYVLFHLNTEPNLLTELNRELRLMKEVMRHCIMKKEEKKAKKGEKKDGRIQSS